MNITIFVASGAFVRLLVRQSVNNGYISGIYIQNPSTIELKNQNLITIQGASIESDIIKQAIAVADVGFGTSL